MSPHAGVAPRRSFVSVQSLRWGFRKSARLIRNVDADNLSNTNRLVGILAFDRDGRDNLDARGNGFNVCYFNRSPNPRADGNGCRESNLVRPVVDSHSDAVDNVDLPYKHRDHRSQQMSVGDGGTERSVSSP